LEHFERIIAVFDLKGGGVASYVFFGQKQTFDVI